MKKIFSLFIAFFVLYPVFAAQIVNIDYIHTRIADRWGITIPYNPAITNVGVAANMKYLLTSVDVANQILNGEATTDYGNGIYATKMAADTIVSDTAINTLIRSGRMPFWLTTTEATSEFQFSLSAQGTFQIDWGDGTTEVLERTDTNDTVYTHSYDTPGTYTIQMDGRATAYSNVATVAAISFNNNQNVASINGNVGMIFPTLSNGKNPNFYYAFANMANVSGSIPPALFSGVTGAPIKNMFYGTFYGNSLLSGSIPSGLFSGLNGVPQEGIFYRTFENCSGLTGDIPLGLFAGISGPPARDMFHSTFAGCKGLTGIAGPLFSAIYGPPAQRMYNATFSGCTGLVGNIPAGLFGRFNGPPQELMFGNTFFSCSGLTGSIPENLFAGINSQPVKRMFEGTFSSCTGLTGSVPAGLFADISGAPAESMFYNTFANCKSLTGVVPTGLFAKISGTVATQMFYRTFYNCEKLQGIQDGIFGDLVGDYQPRMFAEMFYKCVSLTGESAKIGGRYLYEIWPDPTKISGAKMYFNDEGLTDYATMPKEWK